MQMAVGGGWGGKLAWLLVGVSNMFGFLFFLLLSLRCLRSVGSQEGLFVSFLFTFTFIPSLTCRSTLLTQFLASSPLTTHFLFDVTFLKLKYNPMKYS